VFGVEDTRAGTGFRALGDELKGDLTGQIRL
jgi:hypothetical protein